MKNAFSPLSIQDFQRLANACGIPLSSDDLVQLHRRQFFKLEEGFEFCSLHLFTAAIYLEAVTVIRHPWATRAAERRVEDVKARSIELERVLQAIRGAKATAEDAQSAASILLDIERFLAEVDPFGPIGNIIDVLRPEVIQQLRGKGRLYAELRKAAAELAECLEDITPDEHEPNTGEFTDEDPRKTASLDISELETTDSPRTVHERATVERSIADEKDSFDEDEDHREATELIEVDESRQTVRTQSLMSRLEDLKRKETPEPPADLEAQIAELNQLRETYIQDQNWPALAELYESRIELFEDPAERQQIHLSLGAIYESKLANPRKAFESFVFAVETGGPATDKALEGLMRTGQHADAKNSYRTWLEDRISKDISTIEKRTANLELAKVLKEDGESQRAFLLFAAFLASEPETHITTETLATLESLSEEQGEEALDEFLNDILEATSNPRVVELVGLRGAMSYLSRSQNLLAIRNLRKVLEVAPNNEVAFSNLSRLYEAENNFGDLASIIRARLTRAPSDLRPNLEAALEKAYEGELKADPDAVSRWTHLLDQSPDDELALRRAIFGFATHSRHAECYSFLSGLATNVKTDEQRSRILIKLADIALNHLDAPEECREYLESALELTGTSTDILGGFVDLHMHNEEFINAMAGVESLLSISENLSREEKLEWLQVGVEAAELAYRDEEKEKFLAQIREIESTHI